MQNFKYRKYVDLAYSSKPGKVLIGKVEKNWFDWVEKVYYAPWYTYWRGLHLTQGHTPLGKLVEAEEAGVAERIFVATVWGFGINDWMHREASLVQREMLRLQGYSANSVARSYTWDKEYRARLGIFLPCEVADLDRWLESLV